jgi:hypothetical protein
MALNADEHAQASSIMNTTRQRAAQIARNAKLSLADRRILLARNHQAGQAALDELHTRADERAEAEGRRAWQQAFGLPSQDSSTVLAYRDAVDRLAKATPREAARLLDQAVASGDRTLAAACGARAMTQAANDPLQSSSWGRVLETYAGTSPARQQAISVLAGQAADAKDSHTAINGQLMRKLPTPGEIRGADVGYVAGLPLSTEDAANG